MSTKKAFPHVEIKNDGSPPAPVSKTRVYHKGMDLRDYFAAQLMPALVAKPNERDPDGDSPERAAHLAYRCADALIKEREQQKREE